MRDHDLASPAPTSSGDLIADRRYRYGGDLAARGDHAAAADLFEQAIEQAPGFVAAWFGLGEARMASGEPARAVMALRRAVELDPSDRHGAGLRLARLGAAAPDGAMSTAYVCGLFDQYAPHFDDALERLAYRAPELLRQAVERWCRNAGRSACIGDVLDLGCGTGLAGALLRPLARTLTGVDLSVRMVEQARARQLYDRLEVAELTGFLRSELAGRTTYDTAVAADVFVYVFDLAPVAAAVAAVLRPGGLFGFTVETHESDGVELGEKLRYRHGEANVRTALASAGFRVVELARISSRTEAGEAVPGLLVLAARSSPDEDPRPAG